MNEQMMEIWDRIADAGIELLAAGAFFVLFSLILKGRGIIDAAKRSLRETKVNLAYYFTDAIFVVPLLIVLTAAIREFLGGAGLTLFSPEDFTLPVALTAFLAIFVSDFVAYWRHRMMHLSILWPAHAVHHSDRELTWLALVRFHPVNRLIAIFLDITVLTLLGFPAWAVALNSIVRHYYGFFVHADIPWTYGPLGRILVSPVMHRWHHVREVEGAGANFATIFSLFDVAFGTFYVPHKNVSALGVSEPNFPATWAGQIMYPFRVWGRGIWRRISSGPKSPWPAE